MEGKGVIISIYVESSSAKDSQYRSDPLKRTANNSFLTRPSAARTRGYDRRAQLLAYAHELRHANSTHPQCSNNPKQKHKKKRWRRRIGLSFSGLFRGKNKERGYEQMETEDYCNAEEPCHEKGSKEKKMRGENEKATSSFLKKLRCFLKDISCIWQFGKK